MNYNINEEKTENPTEHRVEKFRKQGTTRYSRELNSLLILLVGFINLYWYRNSIFLHFKNVMWNSFSFQSSEITQKNFFLKTFILFQEVLLVFLPFAISLMIIIIIPQIFFSGIKINFRSLKFNLKKLNLFDGLKKIFSFQMIIEFFKSFLKLIIIISISIFYLLHVFLKTMDLINENFMYSLSEGYNIVSACCILVILGLFPIVLFDILWKQFHHHKKMKMSHQEIKDEFREKEGNPHIKNRIRQEMQNVIRRRMISDIPNSDVIIVNPIQYAIALKYDEKNMHAPKVIAKGAGVIALKIKNLALKNDIPIVSAPLLARSLYRYTAIGQYIPSSLYTSVAEVIAWVWKVRAWKKKGGIFPECPNNITIPSDFIFKGEYKKDV